MTPLEVAVARDAIRDLVARYNANADSARFEQVLALFTADAVMEVGDRVYRGHDGIAELFTGTRDRYADAAGDEPPTYLRHFTATHQIDVVDERSATGRCYFSVVTPVGLDHWGRYVDTYRSDDDAWRFATRRVTTDGFAPDSLFGP